VSKEPEDRADSAPWRRLVREHQTPSRARATWQLVNSLGAYVAVWALMYVCASVSWWLVVPLAVLAGGLLVRVFILFHDCGHGSFYASRRANDIWGVITGLVTFTPYVHWRWQHASHHATAGNLDRRGIGDVWTMTVQEYLRASRWRRFTYRLSRNTFVLFVLAPLVLLAVLHRLPAPEAGARERRSVWWTNLAVLALAGGMSLLFGFVPYLVIQAVVFAVAGTAGVWLFYVQHQFEDAYWARSDEWDFTAAALKGSSYYELPKVLQWFSGNIGFHHIHHLSPRIPNYNLERCHRSDPLFHGVRRLTLLSSLELRTLQLWDESTKKLIDFRKFAALRVARAKELAAERPLAAQRD
jgi:omega-6 fatty acid desaturase (delta-12 desaturase)